jgi:hypothetical protein
MYAAVDADLKIPGVKTGAHQRDRGRRGHDELEEGDGAIRAGENLHAPKIDQKIQHHQNRADAKTRYRKLAATVGRMHV